MPSGNSITIWGHLGKNAEIKSTSGGSVCTFSVATTQRSGKGENAKEYTTWFNVSYWGAVAEAVQPYLTKGKNVIVVASRGLRTEEYTDRDGNKRMSIEVRADLVTILDKRESGAAAPEAIPASKSAAAGGDDDIPF
jgi:single-strand DNA-binding protein